MELPAETWVVTAVSNAFIKQHRGCKVRDGGEFCAHCSQQGHAPSACPRLNAKSIDEWLRGPDTGLSSRTIIGALTGNGYALGWGGVIETTVPMDPSDFGRCYRLLKLFPDLRARLPEVAEKHWQWRGLVDAWPELEALYEEELPSGKCPKLYARMREIWSRP
jgi:hypothetical protein